jgi:hypothetical protein
MISIGEITPIPCTILSSNKKQYTHYTYLFEFLNDDNNPIEITTPISEIVSDANISDIETKIKGNSILCNVKLNIKNDNDRSLFSLKIQSIEDEIYKLIRKDYKYIQISNNRGIENIQTKYEMKDNICDCIDKKEQIIGTLSIMGCITIQNTFELIYTLEKIKCQDVLDEIFNILLENENLLNNVKEELYNKIEGSRKNEELITICDIKSVEDVEFLQSEINKIINE